MDDILLSDAPTGQKCTVKKLSGRGAMKNRLMDLGLIEGSFITPLFDSIFKNPRAYNIRGAVIALRREDTDLILVKTEK